MQGVHAVQDDAGRAGAGEGCGDLLADIAGFANTQNNHLAAPAECVADELNRLNEGLIELRAHFAECAHLDVEHGPGAR
jgi:hypothetical protein